MHLYIINDFYFITEHTIDTSSLESQKIVMVNLNFIQMPE